MAIKTANGVTIQPTFNGKLSTTEHSQWLSPVTVTQRQVYTDRCDIKYSQMNKVSSNWAHTLYTWSGGENYPIAQQQSISNGTTQYMQHTIVSTEASLYKNNALAILVEIRHFW